MHYFGDHGTVGLTLPTFLKTFQYSQSQCVQLKRLGKQIGRSRLVLSDGFHVVVSSFAEDCNRAVFMDTIKVATCHRKKLKLQAIRLVAFRKG